MLQKLRASWTRWRERRRQAALDEQRDKMNLGYEATHRNHLLPDSNPKPFDKAHGG
jgi:hypothetical protein